MRISSPMTTGSRYARSIWPSSPDSRGRTGSWSSPRRATRHHAAVQHALIPFQRRMAQKCRRDRAVRLANKFQSQAERIGSAAHETKRMRFRLNGIELGLPQQGWFGCGHGDRKSEIANLGNISKMPIIQLETQAKMLENFRVTIAILRQTAGSPNIPGRNATTMNDLPRNLSNS